MLIIKETAIIMFTLIQHEKNLNLASFASCYVFALDSRPFVPQDKSSILEKEYIIKMCK